MIGERVKKILLQIPEGVTIVAATKGRSVEEIREAVEAGITVVGENYVQEAEKKYEVLKNKVKWHCIGHLQKNKVKKAVKMFDMIQSLDSLELAAVIDKECGKINKVMPALIEVNCARESQKTGILPEEVETFLKGALIFSHIKFQGLMTMGPFIDDEYLLKPYFKETKQLFDVLKERYKQELPQWQYLSMGMSNSYNCAIEEGANMVRLGTIIFGPREYE